MAFGGGVGRGVVEPRGRCQPRMSGLKIDWYEKGCNK